MVKSMFTSKMDDTSVSVNVETLCPSIVEMISPMKIPPCLYALYSTASRRINMANNKNQPKRENLLSGTIFAM